jgi:hypothetical protein
MFGTKHLLMISFSIPREPKETWTKCSQYYISFVSHPGQNQLGEVCRHLGQQREAGLGMGSRGRVEMGP